ncbi:hypothetical protein OH77DRAFT_1428974 [Trametes cingulata]|nr:hypothetical protein OH77DRAFT_1428974 [Trametes cingulata]
MLARYDTCPAEGCLILRLYVLGRAACRSIGGRIRQRASHAEAQPAEKRCPSPYSCCLRFFRRPLPSQHTQGEATREHEGAADALPMSMMQSTGSRPSAARKQAQHTACFANSRSTSGSNNTSHSVANTRTVGREPRERRSHARPDPCRRNLHRKSLTLLSSTPML